MDALSGIAQPELREILLFVRGQARPASADEVSSRFRVHRSVARGRLERLVEAGLLQATFERRSGRSGPGAGRPAKVYGVPPETHAIEFPRRYYEQLLAHMLEALPEEGREDALARVGMRFAADLAAAAPAPPRGARPAPAQACAALAGLGFQATVVEETPTRVVIETPTCPLRPLVVSRPETAAVDRGLWTGLVTSYLPGDRPRAVACHTEGCLDAHASCRVVVELASGDPETG